MFSPGPRELIIVLVIILLLFGPTKLPQLAKALGHSVNELKKGLKGMSDDVEDATNQPAASPPVSPPQNAEAKPDAQSVDTNPSDQAHKV